MFIGVLSKLFTFSNDCVRIVLLNIDYIISHFFIQFNSLYKHLFEKMSKEEIFMRNINTQLDINVAGKDIKIFMQGGFFKFDITNTIVHEHTYTELHVVESGCVEFYIDGQTFTLCAGEMIVIPEYTFHYTVSLSENARHSAFQVSYTVKEIKKYTIPSGILSAFLDEIDRYADTRDCVKLSTYFALLCAYIISNPGLEAVRVQDRDLIIHEFFSQNYNQRITLTDLAERLNVSKKQAERIILRHTGNTFRAELSKRRMEAALQLIKTEDISMAEVATRCGYNSYSGFWKAYKACIDNKPYEDGDED